MVFCMKLYVLQMKINRKRRIFFFFFIQVDQLEFEESGHQVKN